MDFIGEISALSAAVLWSFSSFLFTALSIRIGTLQLNLWRLVSALLLIYITILLTGIQINLTEMQYLLLFFSGIAGLVLGDTFLFASFKRIGPRISMLIMSLNPAIAAVVAYFVLNETISGWGIFGMVLTLSGIVFVIIQKNVKNTRFNITVLGIVFAFLAAFGQGIGLILAKMAHAEGEINSLVATLIRIVSAIVILAPVLFFTNRFDDAAKNIFKQPKVIGLIVLGSIIGPYLGITLSYLAIIYTKVGIASTLMSVVPVIMLPLSIIIYKEKITLAAVFGTCLAVAGVVILFLK